MKYLLLLPVLTLIGAGCVATPNIQPTDSDSEQLAPSEETQQTDGDDEGGEEALDDEAMESADDADETASSDDVTTVTTDEGLTVMFEDTDASDDEKDDDGVPVTDIVLGGATQSVTMETGNFFFSPKTIEAKPGEKIKVFFSKNVGFHTFVIDELDVKFAIKEGEGLVFKAPTEPGSYAFYCDIGSHRANGMEGTLIVK